MYEETVIINREALTMPENAIAKDYIKALDEPAVGDDPNRL